MAAQRRNRRRGADVVSTLSNTFNNLFGDRAHIAFDRAAAELRNGRPIVIEAADGATIVAALDDVAPHLYSIFKGLVGSRLVVSAKRATALGVQTTGPVAFPLNRLDCDTAQSLATTPYIAAPAESEPGSEAAAAALAICKYALLLPTVLSAPLGDEITLPDDLYRVPLDRLHAPATGDVYDLEIISEAEVPLAGNIQTRFVVMRGGPAPRDQVAVIVGKPDMSKPIPVRVHSACLTGDMFGSLRCDCGDQLRNAIARLNVAGGGVLLYLDQEGRGIGIANKMRAYSLQDDGFDTIDADSVLGFDSDERRYEYAAAMLAKLGYRRIALLTNNPSKIEALTRAGIEIAERQSLTGAVTAQNLHYLHTKARRADHMLDDLLESVEPLDWAEPLAGAGE
jgi:GTP cyclohydrolase II